MKIVKADSFSENVLHLISVSRNNQQYFNIFNGTVHKLDQNCIYGDSLDYFDENIINRYLPCSVMFVVCFIHRFYGYICIQDVEASLPFSNNSNVGENHHYPILILDGTRR